ncbi:MAG: hypothetical protein WEC12_01320, partial [Balneolaceae bacterium]
MKTLTCGVKPGSPVRHILFRYRTGMSVRTPYRFPYSKYPAVRVAVFFAAGISFSAQTALPFQRLFTVCLAVWLTWLALEMTVRHKLAVKIFRVSLAAYLLVIFLSGAFWYDFHQERLQIKQERVLLAALFPWEEIDVEGK